MKNLNLLTVVIATITICAACDKTPAIVPSEDPVIASKMDDIYATPGQDLIIEAKITDDVALKSVQIQLTDFSLNKTISFEESAAKVSYNLEYAFTIPATADKNTVYDVVITVEDYSKNIVTKTLKLHLDAELDAPVLSNVLPSDGSVVIASGVDTFSLEISFEVADETGIDTILVKCPDLNIEDLVLANGAKTYSYNKAFTVSSKASEYTMSIRVADSFAMHSAAEQSFTFTVASKLTSLYLADCPYNTDLSKYAIIGYPIIQHGIDGNGNFIFQYYAAQDNTEIFFLGQPSSWIPLCYGLGSDGNLVLAKSQDSAIKLANKGYYTITVNPVTLTYSCEPFTPEGTPATHSADCNAADAAFFMSWGFDTNTSIGWDWAGWNERPGALLVNNPDNPWIIENDVVTDGNGISLIVTGPGWAFFWRIHPYGVVYYNTGVDYTDFPAAFTPGVKAHFAIDTAIDRYSMKVTEWPE